MNKPTDLIRRSYEFFIASGAAMQSPLLLGLRLYFFWQLFLTGKGKLANIEKVSEFFGKNACRAIEQRERFPSAFPGGTWLNPHP
jgi:uncharacterized membrane protein YphA (DoxX/SURF4 family)